MVLWFSLCLKCLACPFPSFSRSLHICGIRHRNSERSLLHFFFAALVFYFCCFAFALACWLGNGHTFFFSEIVYFIYWFKLYAVSKYFAAWSCFIFISNGHSNENLILLHSKSSLCLFSPLLALFSTSRKRETLSSRSLSLASPSPFLLLVLFQLTRTHWNVHEFLFIIVFFLLLSFTQVIAIPLPHIHSNFCINRIFVILFLLQIHLIRVEYSQHTHAVLSFWLDSSLVILFTPKQSSVSIKSPYRMTNLMNLLISHVLNWMRMSSMNLEHFQLMKKKLPD